LPEPARQRRLMIGPSDIQIILGKVRPLSRPLTEAHPQVLIIALAARGLDLSYYLLPTLRVPA
ncbi:hypothetical protein, partial [Mycolicibacterium goodii]|uniref:hypothetical protein n=1 Tax=Mycolicibacterium goodii TaxID=134601 RepID=UPI00256EBD47